ncbi:hypothetical protein, partial [Klebsiella pneumoniae]|uniref:hypothetical protein n=1 Tax=Klebsiella pneumoniae TaxID=573 RepID=UPI0029D95541
LDGHVVNNLKIKSPTLCPSSLLFMPIKGHVIAMERYTKVKEENTSPFFLSLLIYILLHCFYFIT